MKFDRKKQEALTLYILDKIACGGENVAGSAAEAFDVSNNAVYSCLNRLIKSGVVNKNKRGSYSLVSERTEYVFSRSAGELQLDTYAYDVCMKDKIREFPENVQIIWQYAFTEMVNNVIDHSEAEHMRVTVEKDYYRTQATICDDGVGIFEKIKKHFSYSSVDDAVCELFKGKLTTDEQNHSGEGIFFSSKMMDAFLIVSGGKVFTTSKYDESDVEKTEIAASGTAVFMSLSNWTKKNASEIFNLYSNADYGFTRTLVPLKNIFDSAPVSRSQAKRICNRLDRFNEVIIDFNGIGWIGQGFAHQIFVVFQNSHPDLKLIPQNMNDGVADMIKHVKNTV